MLNPDPGSVKILIAYIFFPRHPNLHISLEPSVPLLPPHANIRRPLDLLLRLRRHITLQLPPKRTLHPLLKPTRSQTTSRLLTVGGIDRRAHDPTASRCSLSIINVTLSVSHVVPYNNPGKIPADVCSRWIVIDYKLFLQNLYP